jgi:flagellar FliL protein
MADEENNEEVAEEGGEKKKSNLALILIIVLLVFILIGGAIAAFLLMSEDEEVPAEESVKTEKSAKKKSKKRSAKDADLLEIGPMYPMDQFIVNLLSDRGSRYLKVSMDLELENEEMTAELDTKKAVFRHLIIRLLSSKTFEDVATAKGKDRVKNEILDKLNEVLSDGEIVNIFFTDFVVQ